MSYWHQFILYSCNLSLYFLILFLILDDDHMTVDIASTDHSDQMIHDDHISDSTETIELKHHNEGKELSE